MANVTFKASKNDQGGKTIDLTIKQLTQGELLAIVNALQVYASASPKSKDVLAYIRNGASYSRDEEILNIVS